MRLHRAWGEGQRIIRLPLAGLIEVSLNVRDERVRVALLVGMDDHAGRLVREQDVLVLVNDGETRRFDFFVGFFFGRAFKKLVVDV